MSITNPNDTPARNFTYDALDRLSSATVNPNGGQAQTITYSYDAQGRLTTKAEGGALVYNSSSPFHAVKSASDGSAYGYDANGNMTARSNVGGKNYTLTYDPENRLTGVSGDANASYVYDGDGNRVLGTVNGVTTVYIGNYYEVRLPNSPVSYYYAGGQRVAQRPATGAAQYLFSDHLGSTALVTDGSLNLISEIRYNPWGGVRAAIGTPVAGNAFTYTGQRQEAALGLMFYQARWYDAQLGHFLSPDTVVPDPYNPVDHDRFQYVRSNPINYNDPTGHAQTCLSNDEKCSMDYTPFPELAAFGLYVSGYSDGEIAVIKLESYVMGSRLRASCGSQCDQMTEAEVFKRATGGSMVDRNYTGAGCNSNGIISCNHNIDLTTFNHQGLFTHEVGHAFGTTSGSGSVFGYAANAIYDDNGVIIAGMSGLESIRLADGYRENGKQPYVQHDRKDMYEGQGLTVDKVNMKRMQEEYADEFRNWVWNSYDYDAANGAGKNRFNYMDSHMGDWSRTAIFR